jgi:hypothetical protein
MQLFFIFIGALNLLDFFEDGASEPQRQQREELTERKAA